MRTTILAASLSLLASGGCNNASKPAEHVLLVVVDTLRADHLSAYGYTRPTSPNLDAFAARGVLFEQAISQCSYTAPSMVSMLTGHYLAKERYDLPTGVTTLAESFQRAGFATGAFVTNPVLSEANGFARGFERFEHLPEYGSNEVVEHWLGSLAGKRSFTYVHITEPHDSQGSYGVPGGPGEWRSSSERAPGDREAFWERTHRELGLADFESSVAKMRAEIGGYDEDVRYADGRVAQFLQLLERYGLRENAAVAIAADHGEGLWQRVAFMNGQRSRRLRDGEKPTLENTLMPTHGNQVTHDLVHVPLLLSAPGMPAGKRVKEAVENVDLYPTLLELCDLPVPSGLHGRSLVALARGVESAPKPFAFSFTRFNATVVTNDGLQFILPTLEGECAEQLVPELYDLRADPEQRVNLAEQRPEVVRELTRRIEERLAMAIQETGAVTDADLAAMAQLGYVDQKVREEARRAFEAQETPALLARLNPGTPCDERLMLAEELEKRTLDEPQRAKVAAARVMENSRAVQAVLDRILAR
jgi:arylsulfatase A-like enzyme